MDLIYANALLEDIGQMIDFSFDLAFGKDENNFEIKMDRYNHCCQEGYFAYIENTEYGGVIDTIKVSTKNNTVSYKGRTWHGILASKVLCPDNNQNYLVVNGEANTVINQLINRLGLSGLFEASSEDSLINIRSYQMDRYIDGYNGIKKMLIKNNAKLLFEFKNGKVKLSAVPLVDYTQDEQFDSDQLPLTVEKKYNTVNHLICLGRGELKDRQVVHLYADNKGNISRTQSIFGTSEIVATYDYSNAESLDDLIIKGTETLENYLIGGKASMSFNAEEYVYDIGDIVGAKEIITNISIKSYINKKIVKIEKETIKIEYKVGD